MKRTTTLAILCAVAACGMSPTARFYTLDAVAVPDGAPAASYSIAVGPVTVPAAVDRAQLVVQTAPNRVDFDEFNRWAAPLDDGIAAAVAQDLGTLLGTPNVVAGAYPPINPAYRVRIDVQRFESTPGREVLVDAAWVVYGAKSKSTRSGRTAAREPVSGGELDGIAAAHSRALATVSADIAKAIRDDSASTR